MFIFGWPITIRTLYRTLTLKTNKLQYIYIIVKHIFRTTHSFVRHSVVIYTTHIRLLKNLALKKAVQNITARMFIIHTNSNIPYGHFISCCFKVNTIWSLQRIDLSQRTHWTYHFLMLHNLYFKCIYKTKTQPGSWPDDIYWALMAGTQNQGTALPEGRPQSKQHHYDPWSPANSFHF